MDQYNRLLDVFNSQSDTVKSKSLEKKQQLQQQQQQSTNAEEEDTQTTLEIYLQIDLIKGVLNDEIISRIECGLRGIFLVKMYKELKLKETYSFKLSKHRPLIDINNMEEEINGENAFDDTLENVMTIRIFL
jgi:hypothetical protein